MGLIQGLGWSTSPGGKFVSQKVGLRLRLRVEAS